MIEKLYKFTYKETGDFIGYSRHEYPDFVYMRIVDELGGKIRPTQEEQKKVRDKYFIMVEVTDKKEIEENTW